MIPSIETEETDFVEEQVFGQLNIEEWLARQRTAERPEMENDGSSKWHRHLGSGYMLFVAHGEEIETLLLYADPLKTIPEGSEEHEGSRSLCRRIATILRSFDPVKTRIYYGHVYGPIVVCMEDGRPQPFCFNEVSVEWGNPIALKAIHYVYVMDAIFATWMRGGPKALVARSFLCDTLARGIKNLRKMEEQE